MAQHDYVIANGTGAAVRSDLNNALSAIVSNNSGATEPTPTYAYQWWPDTTTGLLKIRNAANNAWVTVGTLASANLGLLSSGGTVTAALGSASTPGITFTGDTNTGIYSPGADQVAISTNGTGRLFVDSSGNVTINGQGDLRLADSDSSNWVAFQAPATVASNVTWTLPSADGSASQVLSTDGAGTLSWASPSSTQISQGNTSAAVIDTGSDGRFVVTTEGSERARIDSSGRLLVGTSTSEGNMAVTPQVQLEGTTVDGSTSAIKCNGGTTATNGSRFYLNRSRGTSLTSRTVVASDDTLGTIFFGGADGANIQPAASIGGFVDGTPGAGDMPGRLVFSTTADGASSPTERMRILNNGTTDHRATTDVFNVLSNAAAGTTNLLIRGGNSATSFTAYNISFGVYTNGNVVNTNGSYTTLSDAKLKENIVDAGSQWDDLKAIQIRNWNFKAETGHETHRQIGPIAQELETVCPGLVFETPDRDADGNETGEVTKGVNQSVLYMKAVKALQEAMERIEQLESEMAAVKAQLS